MKHQKLIIFGLFLVCAATLWAEDINDQRFVPPNVFDLEFAADPQISPDGTVVAYVRTSMDTMKDRARPSIWLVTSAGDDHRPLLNEPSEAYSPRWTPDGKRLAFISRDGKQAQIYLRWMESGETAVLTQLDAPPSGLTWSPDGKWIAFSMLVREESPPFVTPPAKPEGAEWASPPTVIRKMIYRADGEGYLEDGFYQLFVLPAEGGTPRQLTSGAFHHRGALAWMPDSESLVFSANRHANAEADPLNSEIYQVELDSRRISQLTNRQGPDQSPAISPNGRWLAYAGFDDRLQGYQVTRLSLLELATGQTRPLLTELDRDIEGLAWAADSEQLYFQFDDKGDTRIARVNLSGEMSAVTNQVGGLSLGRPYSGGSFSLSASGRVAFTSTDPAHPAEVGVASPGQPSRVLTRLNHDLFGHRTLASVEEIWVPSSFDGRPVQAWIATPPGFDSTRKYPLILEIHGGPFANYGSRFAAEIQLYASAGYVVVYANPRGSTSYGEEFGNLIHHNYPGEDYDDLMSVVDAVIARGSIDENNLYVTGGSGGGVLTSWIVGKTDRFRAAVVAKPVINWYSFVLTADAYNFFVRYWFPGPPWEHPEEYLRRSPLSLVGNVTTPTMLLTGEADYRTPISESEQFFQALKLRNIDAALVRIPGASHDIAARPSQLIAKVTHILKWFELHHDNGTGKVE